MTDHDLDTAFKNARQALPTLTEDTEPLGVGRFGLTVSCPDHSIRKILFTHDLPALQDVAEASYNQEVSLLDILSHRIDFTPVLIASTEPVAANSGYFASYRMSRIEGTSYSWTPEQHDKLNRNDAQTMAYSAGKLLARFHKEASQIDDVPPVPEYARRYHTGRIQTLPFLDDETNAAMTAANKYLEHAPPGVIHGDFHGLNIINDDRYTAVGLIDFAAAGWSDNLYYDLMNPPEGLEEEFLSGYEAENGTPVDRQLLAATHLSVYTEHVLDMMKAGRAIPPETATKRIKQDLAALSLHQS